MKKGGRYDFLATKRLIIIPAFCCICSQFCYHIANETEYENENKIWSDVEKILGINTNFVVLNRVPSTLVDSTTREGEPIIIITL